MNINSWLNANFGISLPWKKESDQASHPSQGPMKTGLRIIPEPENEHIVIIRCEDPEMLNRMREKMKRAPGWNVLVDWGYGIAFDRFSPHEMKRFLEDFRKELPENVTMTPLPKKIVKDRFKIIYNPEDYE